MRNTYGSRLATRLLIHFDKARTDAVDIIFVLQSAIRIEPQINPEFHCNAFDEFWHSQRPLSAAKQSQDPSRIIHEFFANSQQHLLICFVQRSKQEANNVSS